MYNAGMAFASFSAEGLTETLSGPYCFKIHGQVHRMMPTAAVPGPSVRPLYNQLYFLDVDMANNIRLQNNENCLLEIFNGLEEMLRTVNPYFHIYNNMKEIMNREAEKARDDGTILPEVTLAIKSGLDKDPRRYNVPAAVNEVAAVFVGEAPPANVDVIVYPKDRPVKRLNNLASSTDPMVYPLLFPHGEQGHTLGLQHQGPGRTAVRNTITLNQFYCNRLQIRDGFSILHSSSKLFQQYCVDAYCRVESNRLQFVKDNQKLLRVDSYKGLMDHVEHLAELQDKRPGSVFILPSSFYGSLRQMKQRYLDAIAMMRVFGKPDLFITFTCNPLWPEIADNLLYNQKASDRPDLVSRVFHCKLGELIEDIMKKQIFGVATAFTYTIEFQKRGLPHAHILLILETPYKPSTAESIDGIVRAELPDPVTRPALHRLVAKHMIHLRCGKGAPCEMDGSCKYHFPKDFTEETDPDVETYPKYRRRDDGSYLEIHNNVYDNRHVVPYNPFLLLKYEAHINVEVCATVRSIKYLFKYIFKGYDCAVVEVSVRWDEIKAYLDCRYVSSPEACWRLLDFELMNQNIVVFQLCIHLPDLQSVLVANEDVHGALQRANERLTHLLSFFNTNLEHFNNYHIADRPCRELVCPCQLLYVDFPKFYCWLQKECKWKLREKGGFNTIGRVSTISPNNRELYFLRLLLHHVKGPTSFTDLRTFEGEEQPTYKEMCLKLNLLQDDQEYEKSLQEASHWQMPAQLRSLFVLILLNCSVTSPRALYDKFKQDFFGGHPAALQDPLVSEQTSLRHIEHLLSLSGKSCRDFNLPEPTEIPPVEEPTIGGGEFHPDLECRLGREGYSKLNNEQREVVDAVLQAITSLENGDFNSTKVFFVDGPAGTGKTFLYNTLLHILRGQSKTAYPTAWTGIAAILLKGGRTCHNLFKLPVPIDESSICNIKTNSKDATSLLQSSLILWDEAPMAPKLALQIVDRLFRDITQNPDIPFGGKVVLMGGDFRQVLPVVPGANRVAAVTACIKRSDIWPLIRKFKLTLNMRAAANEVVFQNYILKIGEGTTQAVEGLPESYFELPHNYVLSPEEDICKAVFGTCLRVSEFTQKAVLCPKNADADKINNTMIQRLPGRLKTFYSVDTYEKDPNEDQLELPLEFIHSLNPPSLPPHELKLKPNAVVMLLRNLDPNRGLCNGTRLMVQRYFNHVLECKILTGSHAGDTVLIPRIGLRPSDTLYLHKFKRVQFPVRLSFAITINKSQGQTFDKVGLYLPKPVFSHGQMYVAFSRVRRPVDIIVQVTPEIDLKLEPMHRGTYTRNIVYSEVLKD